jgi:hypothetical protein
VPCRIKASCPNLAPSTLALAIRLTALVPVQREYAKAAVLVIRDPD